MASSSEIDNRVFDSTTNSIRTTSGGSSGVPTVSFIGDGVASTTLIVANASRRSVKFYNQSSANLYLRGRGGRVDSSRWLYGDDTVRRLLRNRGTLRDSGHMGL